MYVCMYEDLRLKSTSMFVKWFKHESSKRILRIIRTYFSLNILWRSVPIMVDQQRIMGIGRKATD